MAQVALVITGGDEPRPDTYARLPEISWVICADKGLEYALDRGLAVDVCVGDFDSVDPARLAQAKADGVEIRTYPKDKDQTDLELALFAALEFSPVGITVLGAGGGRLDHFFGNLLLLANPSFQSAAVSAIVDSALVTVIHSTRTLCGTVGEELSLFAVYGDAHGITLSGFEYLLDNETLSGLSSQGLSNRFRSSEAEVAVEQGVLVAIQPRGAANEVVAQ